MKPRDFFALPILGALAVKRSCVKPCPPAGAFRVLLLHGVTADQTESFARLLDHILENWGEIDPDMVADRLKGVATPDGNRVPFLVSFDDGFASNFTIVRSLLNERGIKAIFFVCPGLIDFDPEAQRMAVARKLFSRPPRETVERLMTWEEISQLQADGHTIGAHTMSHTRLPGLGHAQLAEEIGLSVERITERTGSRPDWFAYPFGDIGSIDERCLDEIGRHFTYCRSGIRGLNGLGTNPLALHADNIDLTSTFAWQRLTLMGGLDSRYNAARASLASMVSAAD